MHRASQAIWPRACDLRSSTGLEGTAFQMSGGLPGGSNLSQLPFSQGLHTLPFPKRERKPLNPATCRGLRHDPPHLGPHISPQGSSCPGGSRACGSCASAPLGQSRAELRLAFGLLTPEPASFRTQAVLQGDLLGENRARPCSKGPDVRITKCFPPRGCQLGWWWGWSRPGRTLSVRGSPRETGLESGAHLRGGGAPAGPEV